MGYKASKPTLMASKFFVADGPLSVSYRTPSDRIPPPRAEHASEGVHVRGERERVPRGRVRSWRRSDPDEENFELSTNSVYWKGMFDSSMRDGAAIQRRHTQMA
jgi:hypothetical protein